MPEICNSHLTLENMKETLLQMTKTVFLEQKSLPGSPVALDGIGEASY
jgi:hypothetical protein